MRREKRTEKGSGVCVVCGTMLNVDGIAPKSNNCFCIRRVQYNVWEAVSNSVKRCPFRSLCFLLARSFQKHSLGTRGGSQTYLIASKPWLIAPLLVSPTTSILQHEG
jgi:hypothetical protein